MVRPWVSGKEKEEAADRGSLTVVACAVVMALLMVLALAAYLGAAALARHRAAAAADLGALAGATKALQGSDVACSRSRQLVEANGATMTGCRMEGLDVLVEASARVWIGWSATATGRARAGPADGVWTE